MNDPSPLVFPRMVNSQEWTIVHQPTGASIVSCPSEEAATQTCIRLCSSDEIDWTFSDQPPTDELSQKIFLLVQGLEKQRLVCRGQSRALTRSITLARVDTHLRQEFTPALWKEWGAFSSHTFEGERLAITLKLRHTTWSLTLDEDTWHVHPQGKVGALCSVPMTHLAAYLAPRRKEPGSTERNPFVQ